ncbi:zonular occludens toxin [Xanthomonas phaseoli pv. phaseoli]|uniref:Zonular occludens toxin n=1 Tax=Xanthomonas campestris pv. phaseoli TaxID=317013 RepID=A0AB34QCM0_XANCH|nr:MULTISPECIES: zonular occludens toxin domain-containing protein [Xanthomonas]ATS28049.1 zonular occludens toxin [Xanthomonas phaseoli pv. phaseoli]AZU26002.1 zonular occludens toxin [Xanthomonas phaseoli pv. phaseoli]AZU30358.1 zonular occludens toxin [Xanthomonas sp. ISO98C4]KHD70035.1 zonular occludens toxin [Xanthomonas phaseoli pv. phaseoli]KHS23289.1 zonular occludens toxin [Xanthomonas phaseoli pv. phaseoli]
MIGDTASISLLTGLPGSGKSLRIIQAIRYLMDKGAHVYVCNIDGIAVPGTTPWADPHKWQELPPESILFVDEAQEFFPARRGGDPVETIKAMSKIRHDGVRLVLATQQPNYLDTYLRGLVGYHEHLLRQSGKQKTFIFRNSQIIEEVRSPLPRIKKLYDYEVWKQPTECFKFYKSAQVHTMKYQMPALVKKALMILPVAALLAGGAWYVVYQDTMFAKKADAAPANKTAPSGPSLAGTASAGAASRPKVTSAEDYVGQLVPLVADVPWSAPAYVDRAVVSDPHMYCMSSENSCRCVTEQNTRVLMRDDVCRDIARWGEPYNPYKPPHSPSQGQQAPVVAEAAQPKPQAPQQSGAVSSSVQKATRSLGTFPESPAFQITTYTGPTTRDL